MPYNEICYLTAREIREKIRKRELSAVEVMEAHLMQIERSADAACVGISSCGEPS